MMQNLGSRRSSSWSSLLGSSFGGKRFSIGLGDAPTPKTLERGAAEFGYPKTIRVDNGPEFVGKELDLWAYLKGVTLDLSRPGKPTDNAFIESFNGKFRTERLNTNWFLILDEARAKCEAWRREYKEVRPHSAIGNKTPMELHRMAASPAGCASEEAGIF